VSRESGDSARVTEHELLAKLENLLLSWAEDVRALAMEVAVAVKPEPPPNDQPVLPMAGIWPKRFELSEPLTPAIPLRHAMDFETDECVGCGAARALLKDWPGLICSPEAVAWAREQKHLEPIPDKFRFPR